MTNEVSKSDVDPFLWLQSLVEGRLIREAFRRAKAAGILYPEAVNLWCAVVYIDQYGADDHIFVTHDVPIGSHTRDRKSYTEKFTLTEALRLCMTEEERP
jgi:hypothetical protein